MGLSSYWWTRGTLSDDVGGVPVRNETSLNDNDSQTLLNLATSLQLFDVPLLRTSLPKHALLLFFFFFFFFFFCFCLLLTRCWRRRKPGVTIYAVKEEKRGKATSKRPTYRTGGSTIDYRSLYYKLQNIEDHQDILPKARDLLLSFLSDAITTTAYDKGQGQGIFAIRSYTDEKLFSFLRASHQEVEDSYQRYIQNRRSGSPRVLVSNRQHAAEVLTRLAPLKLVDGAWLGLTNNINTPFAHRRITKQLWQILSEELGDGILSFHHTYIYNEMLKGLDVKLLEPYKRDFGEKIPNTNDRRAFKAAVDFLPEIIGFNLHFEGFSFETMTLARELQELKIDAQYFLLQVTMNNAHSGHAMMAASIVTQYLAQVVRGEGSEAAEIAWRRVQAGYALSKHLGNGIESAVTEDGGDIDYYAENNDIPGPYDEEVGNLLIAKAAVAQKIHTACPARIGGKPLSDWLNTSHITSDSSKLDFLRELSDAAPWVVRGNPDKSRLIQEMRRGGKMFGAFTLKEVNLLERWISSMDPRATGNDVQADYWRFTGRKRFRQHPTLAPSPDPFLNFDCSEYPALPLGEDFTHDPLLINFDKNWPKFISMWFAHISLLESVVTVPSRVATELGAAVTRTLRAQYGLSPEADGIFGMDEIHHTVSASTPDLVDIGLEILSCKGINPLPNSLSDILTQSPCEFSLKILSASKYPVRNGEILLGMLLTFLDLQKAVLECPGLLSEVGKQALEGIIERETTCLRTCRDLFAADKRKGELFAAGYWLARTEIYKKLGHSLLFIHD
ncbi:hypothetical protein BDV27DRAFT_172439 [Aspergillus caelatus]|uniref:Uncharacterized protein n=1 Tax=Aspergillus caelatus TaxID=61420 RepID=A0A5N7A567_9EURO|nr:uncharacterized protein BDV27DRAFT_172439 [Aspergillus caelatus]KAE8364346.1 hypothetical protein BDV27DRAFT_172439 [Aspergillus caelatus]